MAESHKEKQTYLSPWKRKYDMITGGPFRYTAHAYDEVFDVLIEENLYLDIETKRLALKLSPSIVSVVSYVGGEKTLCGSGVIIDCHGGDGHCSVTVLTSASVVPDRAENEIEIAVLLGGGERLKGELRACDRHFNLAAVEICTKETLPVAPLRRLEAISVGGTQSWELRPHADKLKISPGDKIIVLGRFHKDDCEIMAAPGTFSNDTADLDCKELLYSTCRITESGVGGAVINCYGEVIGVSFYREKCTPFLPLNIALKWWEASKLNGESRRPSLGVEVSNSVKGVIVQKVTPSSSAHIAGINSGDIITKCDDKALSNSLQLFEAIWEKAGADVKLEVMRADYDAPLHIRAPVDEIPQEKFSKWPLPQKCEETTDRIPMQAD